jgi:hypothetical protein
MNQARPSIHSHNTAPVPVSGRLDPSEKHLRHATKSTLVDHTAEQLKKHNQRHAVRMEHLRGVNDNISAPTTTYNRQPSVSSELARKKLAFSTIYE